MASRVPTIFWKELRETLRDRRVVLGVFVSPLLLTPVLVLIMGMFVATKQASDKVESLTVGVMNGDALPDASVEIGKEPTLHLEVIGDRSAAEDAVRDRLVRAVLVVGPQASAELAADGNARVEILFDHTDDKSRRAQDRLLAVVRRLNEAETARRLNARSIQHALFHPIAVESRNLASAQREGASALAMILPWVVIMSACFSGITPAFDLCAGEKERGTLETLLVSPATRREIILGKLGTISVVALAAGLCSIVGIVLALLIPSLLGGPRVLSAGAVSPAAVFGTLVVIIPLVVTVSALQLLMSAYARNQKEAQAMLLPFMSLVMIPAMGSFLLGPESNLAWGFVPVLNTAMAVKLVIGGHFPLAFLLIAIASSAGYALLMARLTIAMFERESILFRT